jgi:23S rRNA pseudouridine2604 synthase
MRINKYLSSSGFCSRRKADKLVESGKVLINGKAATLGSKVAENDRVEVDGEQITLTKEKIYILYNKPVGVICSSDETLPDNIISAINLKERIFPVGRLDVASSGAILLTNDGEFANRVIHPKFEHDKEYIVRTEQEITDDFVEKMSSGVEILDTKTNPCKVAKLKDRSFRITLKQGLNRQIRRMCETLNFDVKSLTRVRVLNICLGDLEYGEWRHIEGVELQDLLQKVFADDIK